MKYLFGIYFHINNLKSFMEQPVSDFIYFSLFLLILLIHILKILMLLISHLTLNFLITE